MIGFGARRIEVTEEHEILTASTVFFRAGAPNTTHHSSASSSGSHWNHHVPNRRTASVGPGLILDTIEQDDHEHDHDSSSNDHDHDHDHINNDPSGSASNTANPRPTPQGAISRRMSMDHHNLQSSYVSHHVGPVGGLSASLANAGSAVDNVPDAPTPPYSPSPIMTHRHESSMSVLMSPRIEQVDEVEEHHDEHHGDDQGHATAAVDTIHAAGKYSASSHLL